MDGDPNEIEWIMEKFRVVCPFALFAAFAARALAALATSWR